MAERTLSGLTLFNRGKVRDIYDLGDRLLLVATDRISAFDVILPTEIPDKGKILTALSEYWFGVMKDIVPHHLISTKVDDFPAGCRKVINLGRNQMMGNDVFHHAKPIF